MHSRLPASSTWWATCQQASIHIYLVHVQVGYAHGGAPPAQVVPSRYAGVCLLPGVLDDMLEHAVLQCSAFSGQRDAFWQSLTALLDAAVVAELRELPTAPSTVVYSG
jgi:hypothetical protein